MDTPTRSRLLAKACEQAFSDLTKAEPIPAGAHWITVHPNGPGTKGQPLLVQEQSSGVFHVIGGAGGKLNYLKLRGLKDPSQYRQEAAQAAAAKRAARKQQVRRDKELGLHEAKQAARQSVTKQKRQAENDFIEAVSSAMGRRTRTDGCRVASRADPTSIST